MSCGSITWLHFQLALSSSPSSRQFLFYRTVRFFIFVSIHKDRGELNGAEKGLRALREAGQDVLRVGRGQPLLGLRREGPQRQFPGGQAHPETPLSSLPVPDTLGCRRPQARHHRLCLRRLLRQPWKGVRCGSRRGEPQGRR